MKRLNVELIAITLDYNEHGQSIINAAFENETQKDMDMARIVQCLGMLEYAKRILLNKIQIETYKEPEQ